MRAGSFAIQCGFGRGHNDSSCSASATIATLFMLPGNRSPRATAAGARLKRGSLDRHGHARELVRGDDPVARTPSLKPSITICLRGALGAERWRCVDQAPYLYHESRFNGPLTRTTGPAHDISSHLQYMSAASIGKASHVLAGRRP